MKRFIQNRFLELERIRDQFVEIEGNEKLEQRSGTLNVSKENLGTPEVFDNGCGCFGVWSYVMLGRKGKPADGGAYYYKNGIVELMKRFYKDDLKGIGRKKLLNIVEGIASATNLHHGTDWDNLTCSQRDGIKEDSRYVTDSGNVREATTNECRRVVSVWNKLNRVLVENGAAEIPFGTETWDVPPSEVIDGIIESGVWAGR